MVDGGQLVGQLLPLSSSLVVLVPLMSWTLMARVMVGEHREGDVWVYVVLLVVSMVRVLFLVVGA